MTTENAAIRYMTGRFDAEYPYHADDLTDAWDSGYVLGHTTGDRTGYERGIRDMERPWIWFALTGLLCGCVGFVCGTSLNLIGVGRSLAGLP